MKKRILITASTFPGYKGDSAPCFICDYAVSLGGSFEVIVLCPFKKGSKTFEIMEEIKVYRYKYLPFNLGTLACGPGIAAKLRQNRLNYLQVPFFLIFQLVNIIKLVKKYDIKTIHAHWIIPQGLMAVIYKLFFNKNVKILSTAHGADIYSLRSRFSGYLKKFVIKNTDKLTCVSNALKSEILNLHKKENIEILPMGVDTGLFSPEKHNELVREKLGIKNTFLLFTGRLVEKKGLYYLIKAMPEVLRQFPGTKLLIIGEGPEKNSLINLSKSLDLDKNIIFAGPVHHKKLPEYFATADIFTGPSITASDGDSEGFGLVFAEALSCETPVITTDLPAISDIVKNNFNGFTIPQKDVDSLAKKIIFLMKNPDKIKEMGKNARAFAIENFDRKKIAAEYKVLITKMGE